MEPDCNELKSVGRRGADGREENGVNDSSKKPNVIREEMCSLSAGRRDREKVD